MARDGTRSGGRVKGTPNKLTSSFKTAVQIAYEQIGGHEAFAEWARANPSDFYKIAARLIPAERAEPDDSGSRIVNIVIGSVDSPYARPVIEHHQEPALVSEFLS